VGIEAAKTLNPHQNIRPSLERAKQVFVLRYILVTLIGYLLGAVPVGYLVGKTQGIDVRQYGSGRTGGTNVLRALGLGPAFFTVLGDALKGMIAVLVARAIMPTPLAEALAGLGAVGGHNWSVFIGFRGGAGTITALGALSLLSPQTFTVVAPLGLLALLLSRYASVGSLVVSLSMPFVLLGFIAAGHQPLPHLVYGVGVAAIIISALRGNIQRLRTGTERRISKSAKNESP
jgi:glycerol-3-phosphate acyltransferase PlsY